MYYHILFIYSFDGQLGCFHLLATMNNAAMNIGVQIFLRDLLWILLDIYPEVGLLDHVIVLFLIFEEPLYHFP